jgi:methylenetetrahydrofolate dehydrogenase (NADP+)/methenyltetrahydrofolate cyclohydrolase
LKAIELANKDIEECKVLVVGRGFLVGWPVAQCMEEAVKGLVIADGSTKNLENLTENADVIISATGKSNLIKPNMIKEGAVLIDAGTSEVGGELLGDIDPESYKRSSFYTPVPGGIGPVTVAMLLKNLVEK